MIEYVARHATKWYVENFWNMKLCFKLTKLRCLNIFFWKLSCTYFSGRAVKRNLSSYDLENLSFHLKKTNCLNCRQWFLCKFQSRKTQIRLFQLKVYKNWKFLTLTNFLLSNRNPNRNKIAKNAKHLAHSNWSAINYLQMKFINKQLHIKTVN